MIREGVGVVTVTVVGLGLGVAEKEWQQTQRQADSPAPETKTCISVVTLVSNKVSSTALRSAPDTQPARTEYPQKSYEYQDRTKPAVQREESWSSRFTTVRVTTTSAAD